MPDPKSAKEPLSKTPSWIMLGFVVGCIVALTVKKDWEPREKLRAPTDTVPPASVSATQLEGTPPAAPAKTAPSALSLSDMEAVFERWRGKAIWRNELTEVEYWNPTTNKYSDFVEVLRSGDDLYFRTIPRLTRPPVEDNVEPSAPIRFTELEEMRQARRAPFIIPPH